MRQRLVENKHLLYLSQVVFLNDLRAPELVALGNGFFSLERTKATIKANLENSGIPQAKRYTVTNDVDSKNRVLKCLGKMYLQAMEVANLYAQEEKQVLYFSPAIYLRLFVCYRKLLKERQFIVKDISHKYESGLEKIKIAQDAIYKYHRELAERTPALQAKYEGAGGVLEQIEEEFSRVVFQREQLAKDTVEAAL